MTKNFALIHDGRLVGAYATKAAASKANKRYHNGEAEVREVSEQELDRLNEEASQ